MPHITDTRLFLKGTFTRNNEVAYLEKKNIFLF